jgi:hypothetical protein
LTALAVLVTSNCTTLVAVRKLKVPVPLVEKLMPTLVSEPMAAKSGAELATAPVIENRLTALAVWATRNCSTLALVRKPKLPVPFVEKVAPMLVSEP